MAENAPEAEATEQSGAAEQPDAAEQPKETTKDSAQEKAGDPDTARLWRALSQALDNARNSLVGGGTTNVFFGTTSVEHLGDRGTSQSTHHLGVVIRSGPVPRTVLDRIRETYVEPGRYDEIRQRLSTSKVVLFQMRGGSGRTATALRMLDQMCGGRVHKLDPDEKLKTLQGKDLEENHGYLLESLDPDQAHDLRTFQLDRLGHLMDERAARMIVIVDESISLRRVDIGHLLVDDLGAVPPENLLRSHLDDRAGVLDRPEVQEILEELTDLTPRRELERLALLLRDVADGLLEIGTVRERFSHASQSECEEWFDQQTDIDQRAFAIALAVFNEEPVQVVSQAASMLATDIKRVEIPRRVDRAQRLFTVPLRRRLQDAKAELVDTTMDTTFGRVPVATARYLDGRYPLWVLQRLSEEYEQAHEIVREWLLQLGASRSEPVRIRAGMAAGLLSVHDFPGIYHSMIEPWALSGDANARWAAVAALTIPGQHPDLERAVSEVLKRWNQRRRPAALRVTAARALGTTASMSPAACLRLLRQAARYANWDIAYAIGESISDLLVRVDDRCQVYDALVRWTDEEEYPLRRETALLAVLIASSYLIIEVDTGTEKWPALVWDAHTNEAHRERIVLLYSRMLQAAEYSLRGYSALRGWTRIANKDPSLRTPLAQLMHDIGEKSGELESLRFYLESWRDERDGPADAARAVLRHFKQRGA